jgi:hypothetical protein
MDLSKFWMNVKNIKKLTDDFLSTGRRIVKRLIEKHILVEIDGAHLICFKTYVDTDK